MRNVTRTCQVVSICFIIPLLVPLHTLAAPSSKKEGSGTGASVVAGDDAFTVWSHHGLLKIDRRPNLERIEQLPNSQAVRIAGAANEHVSFQLVITPHADRRRNQSPITYPIKQLEPSKLTGPDGNTIPGKRIKTHVVGYVNGVHPDVLFPADTYSYVPDRENHNLWMTVDIPEDTPAGVYRGEINIQVGRARYTHGNTIPAGTENHTFEVPVRLRVWNFVLPTRTHVWPNHYSINGGGGELTDRYPAGETERLKKDLFRKFAARRLSPRVIMPGEAPEGEELEYFLKWAQWWVDRGLYLGRAGDNHAAIPLEDPYLPELRKHGWMDRILVKVGGDESYGLDHSRKLKEARRLEKIAPEVKRMATFNGLFFKSTDVQKKLKSLRGAAPAVDVFSINPGTIYPYPKVVEYLKKDEHEMSWYIHHHLKVEEPAVNLRLFFWKMWRENVRMHTLWATCLWERGDTTTNRAQRGFTVFSDRLGVGNGTLFWPGKDEVLPSIRSDLIRDGIEDFEYHYLLRSLARDTELPDDLASEVQNALTVPDEVVEDFYNTTEDPAVVLRQRRRVARLIERVREHRSSNGKEQNQ